MLKVVFNVNKYTAIAIKCSNIIGFVHHRVCTVFQGDVFSYDRWEIIRSENCEVSLDRNI